MRAYAPLAMLQALLVVYVRYDVRDAAILPRISLRGNIPFPAPLDE